MIEFARLLTVIMCFGVSLYLMVWTIYQLPKDLEGLREYFSPEDNLKYKNKYDLFMYLFFNKKK